jgi:ATP-dependent helicase/nuclease subunit A
MNKTAPGSVPPDQMQRERALDPACSILVQAPAGSGKTDLLARRFLRLLAEVDEPGEVVAITFTIAAASEMHHRILAELEKAAEGYIALQDADPFSMEFLARRVVDRSNARGWNLLDLPAQLRISTIDSFCRDLALQQPLLSGFGGGLDIAEQPNDLYRRAARNTLEQIGRPENPALSDAIEALLDWRDNNWQELEDLLVDMLSKRDRWMHEFVLSRDPDWAELRERLERPFANAVHAGLAEVSRLLDQVSGAREEALLLSRFACSQPGGDQHRGLAELVEFPNAPFPTPDDLEEAHQALLCLAGLLLTGEGSLRKQVDKRLGFPAEHKAEKSRILKLIADLDAVPGLESALADVRNLPPARYTEDDWKIVRACFTLLRHAAGQLKIVFAEAAAVDFIEVAQIAEAVLRADDGFPSEAAMAVADGIRHLLVDEFQDTSRRQHQLLAGLIAAWPDHTGRTCFAVGDPMQSIYFFRDADAELFARVKKIGLEIPNGDPLILDSVSLTANFRSASSLVRRLNTVFGQVFAVDDGSGVRFFEAAPAREESEFSIQNFHLHLKFTPQTTYKRQVAHQPESDGDDAKAEQIAEIVELILSHQQAIEACRLARDRGESGRYRVAILARTRSSLAPIAQALHEAAIPFRALDLEKLKDRPEVLDALALGRALLNSHDRVAWLGVLRAPWSGLALEDLHLLTSADDSALLSQPVPELLAERLGLLSEAGQIAGRRVLSALASVPALRTNLPTASLGTWLQQIWLRLGGADCCDATARANIDLLWACLDGLPAGEQDLLGTALDAALERLTALPDPAASSDCGVQLMTIHKSKGLEFEVVIVPDLQARTRGASRKLLSWLERGLTHETGAETVAEITEFLIAPLQTKGEQSKGSKAWVDRVYRERESQETRRILYVAATRAREELHIFARPAYKVEANGELSLVEPSGNLLSTAWPALEEEIRARFDAWKLVRQIETGQVETQAEDEIESLAAAGESRLFVTISPETPAAPALLRRLPADYRNTPLEQFTAPVKGSAISGLGVSQLYARHEGGLVSRALGTAVHALLEELARLRRSRDWQAARASLGQFEARIAAEVQGAGVAAKQAAQIAANALQIALNASHDPSGEWILSPHSDAANEVRWTGVVSGALTSVRIDRVFRAGLAPLSNGDGAWWIIDYKTAQGDGDVERLRPLFAGQVEAYARVLRNLHGDDSVIRGGLYYPRMLALDWWEL